MNKPFNDYAAWLQVKTGESPAQFRIVNETGKQVQAVKECKLLLEQFYGKECLNEKAFCTLYLKEESNLEKEAYRIEKKEDDYHIAGGSEQGLLYGVYAFLLYLRVNGSLPAYTIQSEPAVSYRVINHWDNMDGSIERGYAGSSFFFSEEDLSYDPIRIEDYARLLASVGINILSFNNVNVKPAAMNLLTEKQLPKVAKLAELFRPFGIRLLISVHFDSPVLLGGLSTADPLDEKVKAWWEETTDLVYQYIPDLAGFLIKADSEFQNGPKSLGRTQADGANVLASALKKHDGVLFWRCFVYNCQQDWRDSKTDRPKAAYEEFYPLDGKFADNVYLQIKYGPTDFQVREPNSPLLGAMSDTKQALEFQLAQEYTGHQIDLYHWAVQWKEILNEPRDKQNKLKDCIGKQIQSICAVSNTGKDKNWTGHLLAQLNLFAFGKVAWNPDFSLEEITKEWIALTFGTDSEVLEKVGKILLDSRKVYEHYNAPLGIGWMVNPDIHYGPNVNGYEFSHWGTYHRASCFAIGIDRTKTGTGFTLQYDSFVQELYENKETCPEHFLLFFHRLPYTYQLKSGKTLIQHIYDTHFQGVEEVEEFLSLWDSLKEKLPEQAYESVRERLERQHKNALEWRDQINTYFYRMSGIPDEKKRLIY
ncbi:xylan alpha-(1-_2)-glucuronosidase [Clostridia bacterium]|nr:xylan alpha-(1->2)-glucuronosidase [Clostridia bacterium]